MHEKENSMEIDIEGSELELWEAECQGCDVFTRVDDLGLCEDCSAKLDRDLIRQRDWDYSATAFGVPTEQREELRATVIKQYGESLELIVPEPQVKPAGKRRGRKSARKRGRSGR